VRLNVISPSSGWTNARAISADPSEWRRITQRRCSESSSASEVSIGVARESPSSAQRADPLQAEAVSGGANPVTYAAQEAERARQ